MARIQHTDKQIFIITHRPQPSISKLQFLQWFIKGNVNGLQSQSGKDIFCHGRAMVENELLKKDLIDGFIGFIIPMLLAEGVRLFQKQAGIKKLALVSKKKFETGLVQMHYNRKRL